jgi:hypothetical protein
MYNLHNHTIPITQTHVKQAQLQTHKLQRIMRMTLAIRIFHLHRGSSKKCAHRSILATFTLMKLTQGHHHIIVAVMAFTMMLSTASSSIKQHRSHSRHSNNINMYSINHLLIIHPYITTDTSRFCKSSFKSSNYKNSSTHNRIQMRSQATQKPVTHHHAMDHGSYRYRHRRRLTCMRPTIKVPIIMFCTGVAMEMLSTRKFARIIIARLAAAVLRVGQQT